MKVSLIGATGPVGQRIMAELLDRGHEVKAVVGDISKLTERTNLARLAPMSAMLRGWWRLCLAVMP